MVVVQLDGKFWTFLGRLLSLLPSPSVAPSLGSSILNELYLTFPMFAAIQSLSLCSAHCGGGSLSCLGKGGGGGACCRF